MTTGLVTMDRAMQTTNAWLADVAREFDTDDRNFAYRVLRAWLHTLRDRLPAEVTAHFAAQLPELLRGVYYDGWDPSRVPVKYGPDEFRQRFAAEARIPVGDVPGAARTVSAAMIEHLSPGQLDTVLEQLPANLRRLLEPAEPGPPPDRPPRQADPVTRRLERLETQVRTLTDAVRTLADGMQQNPAEEPHPDQAARAARLAHDILMTVPGDGS